jgi:drug/metabolite transporter (DMT)-like permease
VALSQHVWPRRIDLISISVAFFGVFLLVTRGHFDSLALSVQGLVWGLLAALSQAGYTLLPGKLLKSFDTVLVVGWGMLLGSGAFVPFLLQTKITFSFSSLLAVSYVVIGGTIFSYLFYLQSLRFLKPTITGMLSAFEPLTAAILGVMLLGLKLNLAEIIGILLVLGTSVLQALPDKRR